MVKQTNSEKDVHTEHCCIQHGCKYFDNDCPVVNGVKTQSFPCQDCEDSHAIDFGVEVGAIDNSNNTTTKVPTLVATGNIYYGILDNNCGTLVDRHDVEAGDYGVNIINLSINEAEEEIQVVNGLTTHNDKKALYTEFIDAQHVKELLSVENPEVSYTVVSFSEKVYRFLEFNVVE